MYLFVGGVVSALLAALRAVYVYTSNKDYTYAIPHLFTPVQPLSIFGPFMPKGRYHRRLGFNWDERATLYRGIPVKTFVLMPALIGKPLVYTSHVSAFMQITSLAGDFYKPARDNKTMALFGENVLSAEGDVWKRHRRVTAPAFSPSAMRNVWETTARVYLDILTSEGWYSAATTPTVNANLISHKVALFLISIVGFGIPMSWSEPSRDANGNLSVQGMVFGVAHYIIHRAVIPRWLYAFGMKQLNLIEEAYARFGVFMLAAIDERSEELKKLRGSANEDEFAESIKDVFGRLVNAHRAEGKNALSEEEIIGNCFIFTFAGHETTANTLAATSGLLALYPDEQEWAYQSIKAVLGDREPTYDDFESLDCVLACFLETMRMFPPGYLVVRRATRDTTLRLSRTGSHEVVESVSIKKGQTVIFDPIGMGYDKEIFPDPEAFRPQRWTHAQWNANASSTGATQTSVENQIHLDMETARTFEGFLGFGLGPRSCVGSKFARVEAVAFLTLLLRDWRIDLVLRSGETPAAWRERVLQPGFGQAMMLGEVPVKLVRR